MNAQKIVSKQVMRLLKILCLALMLTAVLYPILWMVLSSLKAPLEFTENPMYALPEGFYWENYVRAWTVGRMNVFYKNSVITTFVSLIFTLLFSSTISFAIVKMRWKGSKFCMLLFSFGIVVPVQMLLIPLFTIYNGIGIINTRLCLIVTYTGFSMSMAIYLLTGYMRAIPNDIMEAAIIDGCSIYKVFSRIVLPMSKNAVATVLVVSFFTKWNDLIFSMTFISSSKLKTIQTGLLYFQDEFGNKDWGPIFAAITIAILPTILVYVVLNKKVIQGMTEGAVKG
ncbi:MAG: carbohydrate ABC transporter permease [Eubacteriales bacterium]|nr:carbohydrate ABC transporter permease [Eubacteriales bacterium]